MKKTIRTLTTKILLWESKMVLRKYKPKIIAVTGSVGKTSTKDAIYTVISNFKKVRKSEKSYNGDVGTPLTILEVPNGWSNYLVWFENILKGIWLLIWRHDYPDWLVLEIGAGKPDDIKRLSSWIKPDISVFTRFPDTPVHVEFFESPEKIIEEKTYLAKNTKEDGLIILNNDDEKVMNIIHKIKRKTVSYGFHDNATYKASYPKIEYSKNEDFALPSGISFKLEYQGNVFPVMMNNIIGLNHIYAGLIAIAVANEINCDLLGSIEALKNYITPPGRLNLIEGINDSIIIDDSYNASPLAMEAGLDVLKTIKCKRHIALLGDMLELGKYTEEEHKNTGKYVNGIADILVLVGPRSHFIKEGAIEAGFNEKNLYFFESSTTAGKFLEGIIEPGDAILVKGSQGIRMEKAIEIIMKDKSQAEKVLCRQDKEWKKR